MTAETLALYSGIALSLIFSYVPGLAGKFAGLDATIKRLVMLGLLLVVALAVVGIACAGFASEIGLVVTCDKPGFVGVLKAFVFAMIANQATYQVSPETNAVRSAK